MEIFTSACRELKLAPRKARVHRWMNVAGWAGTPAYGKPTLFVVRGGVALDLARALNTFSNLAFTL